MTKVIRGRVRLQMRGPSPPSPCFFGEGFRACDQKLELASICF